MEAIKTFEQYQSLASRTAPKHEDEKINFAMGIAGESGELIDLVKKFIFHKHQIDKIKIKKEAGDVLWYISQLMRIYDITFEDAFATLKKYDELIELIKLHGNPDRLLKVSCLNLSQSVGNVSGYVDMSEFYTIDKLKGNLANALKNFYFIIKIAGLTIEEVAEANIEKLKARYPDGFDPEKSINRVE